MRPALRVVAPLLLLLPLLAAPARADIVHLEGGGRLEGEVEKTTDGVRVRMAGGTVEVSEARIARIERTDGAAPGAGDAKSTVVLDGLLGSARSRRVAAGDAEVLPEAFAALDAASASTERWEAWRGELWDVAFERLRPEPRTGEIEQLRLAAGPDARIHRTQHWIVAHDAPRSEVRRRAQMLEDAWRKFFQLAARMGLRPRPVLEPLGALHFTHYEDWKRAIALPESKIRNLSGVYLLHTGRIYLYETGTAPQSASALQKLDARREQIESARADIRKQEAQLDKVSKELAAEKDDSRAAKERRERIRIQIREVRTSIGDNRRVIAEAEREVAGYERVLQQHSEREDISSTTHEACHQIAFATGVCRPGQALWLIEGLATLFEISSRRTFLVEDGVNAPRLADLRDGIEEGEKLLLVRVVDDSIFASKGPGGSLAYAHSWALSHFLMRTRREAFARFVREASPIPGGPEHAAARVAEFQRFFGRDLAGLQSEWRAFVERL